MARITPIRWRRLVRVFIQVGWEEDHTTGDHIVLVKVGYARPVVIPKYSAIDTFIILNNLKTAGISRTEYFKLLKG